MAARGVLRDSQGSLLNQSWQILTTTPEVQRVLNHRPCDQRHKHGRLPDHFSAFSLQFPQPLCQTLAKQFLVKDSWSSALGILEQLHADYDGRPFNPSASSWKTRLVWTLHHQRWTLIAMLTCRQQSHLLLKQVRPRLRKKKSPIGYRKFINRSACAGRPPVDPPPRSDLAPSDARCVPVMCQNDRLRHWHFHQLFHQLRRLKHGALRDGVL